jgi:hypothetical protein
MRLNIYIDGNNLYRSAKELGFEIDYKKFRVWLTQKYNTKNIYLFIGFLEDRQNFYKYLEECGFNLIFKEAVLFGDKKEIKGNCDAELVLKSVDDYHLKNFDKCILISNDGDFGCLVEFLIKRDSFDTVVSPDKNRCSILLRNKTNRILYLNEVYKKFCKNNLNP